MKQTFVDIEGALPALDRKKIGKPFVVDGRNYIHDFEGPKSAFGCTKIYASFNPNLLMQNFNVGAETFYFARDINETYLQISTVDWASRQIQAVIRLTPADSTRPKLNQPWSHAYVGTYHYFANRTWGILQYDAINKNWQDVTTTIGIDDIFFICESGGRLCCLADGIVSWSAIDDGMDNTPSTATGAGFQALSLVGSIEQDSDYLGMQSTSKGFLSFTTKGVLRSELIDSENPFRHIPGRVRQIPLNPWCIARLDDATIITLTKFGLFRTVDGNSFEEFQPIHNEYLRFTEIPALLSEQNGYLSLYYSTASHNLFISMAKADTFSLYSEAWVLNIKRETWGRFNRVHRALVDLNINDTTITFEDAFIDIDGRLSFLDESAGVFCLASTNLLGTYISTIRTHEPVQTDSVYLMSTVGKLSPVSLQPFVDITAFVEIAGVTDLYANNPVLPDTVIVEGAVYVMPSRVTVDNKLAVLGNIVQDLVADPIDSFIEVGLFRVTDEEASDQVSLFTNVAISTLDVGDSEGAEVVDWLNDFDVDVEEDWLTASGDEDWGINIVTGANYTQKIRGTLDGYETFQDQFADLEEVFVEGKTKFCSCTSLGLFQTVQLVAQENNQFFHLKTLELTGILAGRI